MDTIVLCLEGEGVTGKIHWVIAGHASSKPKSEFPGFGCFKCAGQYLNLVVAYVGIPSLYVHGLLPLHVFWSATYETLGQTMRAFTEALQKNLDGRPWSGGVLIASERSIWKVNEDFSVEESSYPHAVIGHNAERVALSLHVLERLAGDGMYVTGVPGLVAQAITRAWAEELTEHPKGCHLSRFSF